MRLKIGDEFLDSDNSIIAQNYEVNKIGSIETRQGGFSNDFTIPLTSKNKAILEFPDNINSSSRNPYTKVDASLYDLGEPIAEGYLKYQIVDDISLQASFFADNVNWFNLIKDRRLTDLELSDFDHTWTASVIKTAIDADKTSGYTYPLIDYGEFSAVAPAAGIIDIDDDEIFPCMFVSTLLQQVYFDIGWKADGDVLNHALFKRMIVPFSAPSMRHTLEWQTDETINDSVTGADQPFTDVDTTITWAVAGTNITITQGNKYTIIVSVLANITAGDMFISVFKAGPVLLNSILFSNWGGDEVKTIVIEDVELDASGPDTVFVDVRAKTAAATGNVKATSIITLTPSLEVFRENDIQMSALQPNVSQTDFLRYIAFSFGAVLQSNVLSKTVTWSFFRDIKNNDSIDWSDKLDVSKTREVNFTELLNNYASKSLMNYLVDNNDSDLVAYEDDNQKRFGEGEWILANEHIEGVTTFYTAPFASMMNRYSFSDSLYIPSIPWITSGVRGSVLPKIALLSSNILLSDYNADVTSLRIATFSVTVSVTSVPFCWFAKQQYIPDVDTILDSLPFDQVNLSDVIGEPLSGRFLNDYESILNSMKYLKAFVHLNEVDISNLDFTIPVYIEKYKAYFYISKILNFEGRRKTTEAELTKIA